jgi:tRNA(Ile)-lysidine synthase TilS/MesJ
VNHQLRGAESDADEAFCRSLAARLDLPIIVRSVDVAARARARVSLEVAALNATAFRNRCPSSAPRSSQRATRWTIRPKRFSSV